MAWTWLVRAAVGAAGLLALVGALAAFAYGEPIAGFWALAVGGLLIAVAVFEAGRYRSRVDQRTRTEGLEPTGEVFVDPSSGVRTRVWFDPATGERAYRPSGKRVDQAKSRDLTRR